MLDDFLTRAVLAGLGLVLVTGPLGAFVVWRRMAYFGDSTAHASVLGVALALGFGVSVYAGTLLVAVLVAVLVVMMARRGHQMDSALGVLAHSALALGLVGAAFVPSMRSDLTAWLFGDILAVGKADLAVIWSAALAVLALLIWRWNRMLAATVNEELAAASDINPERERLILALLLAVVVAVAIRIVGALLISALLIVPAAAARPLSRSPEAMALIATLIGAGAVLGGLAASLWLDTPAGPSVVVVAAAAFMLSSLVPWGRR
ncbi:MAG: iron chelate uptake ABC transporter family permease subunit [Paracoccus sp. (in: a-proteobacteria)]|uniref:iron chelate uptake ABC transporter family permease subunit n=1 Tax=Paracoccus sp. TaxID=267 RepID=UPI0026DFAF32|nr:iron chelate uptake ABC transporter family permease subunit [Paracoccus sp. (in: a-proteobacteria)]MDO5620438.1 iron chelate uptake ABC transporter family permease subunit [Paracoccus sp. (in: a-proteobacteria)]